IITTSHWRRPITLVLSTTLSGSNIVLIREFKSWWDAQSYCRKHHTDLPSIRNLEENSLVYQIHNGNARKWIGLHRNLRSTWSDGSDSSYRNWKDNIPPTLYHIVPCVYLCSTVFPGVCSALHQYYFVDKSLSWSNAQSHCRQYGGDLATVHGPEYQERLVEVARKYNSDVWIGLYDDVKSWTWSLSEKANYSGGEVERWSWPWGGQEPNNGRDREGCVRIYLEAWDIVDYNRLSDSSFIYVHSRKSWWDAQSYCREHHTDLPSIRNMEENKLVYQIDTGLTWKWIGLHRNLWSMWSDGSDPSYRNWKDNRASNRPAWTENSCTLALSNSGWQWADKQCNSKFKFLCKICSILFQ
uniref:C-type lectin domain-containing protein n=1 Tax=Gadus morhua TaxID=8049 RepID=A0A8C4Z9X8_GADMO